MGERRISVGLPQLPHDQAPDVVRRYAVRLPGPAACGLVLSERRVL
jgi:hypothetical protein